MNGEYTKHGIDEIVRLNIYLSVIPNIAMCQLGNVSITNAVSSSISSSIKCWLILGLTQYFTNFTNEM